MSNFHVLIKDKWFLYEFETNVILLKTRQITDINLHLDSFREKLSSFIKLNFSENKIKLQIQVNYFNNDFSFFFIGSCDKYIIYNKSIFFFKFRKNSDSDLSNNCVLHIPRLDASVFFDINSQLISICENLICENKKNYFEWFIDIFFLKVYAVFTTKYNCILTTCLNVTQKNETFYGEQY